MVLPPELFKAGGIGGGIADGVLNVAVSQIVLNEPCIRPLIGQSEAARMAEHVRMRGERQPGQLSIAAQGGPDGAAIERPPAFADKEPCGDGLHSRSFLEPCLDAAEFFRAERMRGGEALLEPGDMQDAAFGIDLGEGQAAGFRDAQAVAEQQQDQAAVTGFMPCALGGGKELVHFQGGQMLAFAHCFVPSWGFPGCARSTA